MEGGEEEYSYKELGRGLFEWMSDDWCYIIIRLNRVIYFKYSGNYYICNVNIFRDND